VSNFLPVPAILVPQGAEYQAVCRGLSRVNSPKPLVLPIPIGYMPLTKYLEKLPEAGHFLKDSQPKVLLMGLCGSLSPHHAIGDVVVYRECVYESTKLSESLLQSCDGELTTLLRNKLKERASFVRGLTSDRIIYSATEKHHLGQLYNTEVVDMEGFAALKVLSQAGVAVAMVRVISDDSHHNLPNLTAAISPDGSLLPLPLAMGMIRQPIAATRLIRGAIQGLRVLQSVTALLFSR
jgi:hypothetical protein